jgi:hypothetical protein
MFRFSIRDVLWLTALVAIGLGWWAEHRSAKRWQWLAEGLAREKGAGIRFTAKTVTLNWPD